MSVKIINGGKCFVAFETLEEMQAAIEMKGEQLGDRKLFIEQAISTRSPRQRRDQSFGQQEPPSATIFIGGIDYHTTRDDIVQVFEGCG